MSSTVSSLNGKKVLITGHTGFKGTWLAWMMIERGANVVGLARDPHTSPSHFELSGLAQELDDRRLDIRDHERVGSLFREVKPDFVFHLAAQALVRESYVDPLTTYSTNALGTLNVLEALRTTEQPVTAVMITSDKAYENKEWVWSYRENDQIGGSDPYSASKACAEMIINSHVRSFFPSDGRVRIAIGRAGNVIGGGDWSADRIIPDCIRSWIDQSPAVIRSPHSTRPWQHVLEPLAGYVMLAEQLSWDPSLHGEAFNFGPTPDGGMTVENVVNQLAGAFPGSIWRSEQRTDSPHEAGLLQLNCDKAKSRIGWHPRLDFSSTIEWTADWYKRVLIDHVHARDVTQDQIRTFSTLQKGSSL